MRPPTLANLNFFNTRKLISRKIRLTIIFSGKWLVHLDKHCLLKSFNLYFYFIFMDALPTCMFCALPFKTLDQWKWNYRWLWAPCRHWELNYGLLKEQPAFLINEPFFYPQFLFLNSVPLQTETAKHRE